MINELFELASQAIGSAFAAGIVAGTTIALIRKALQ